MLHSIDPTKHGPLGPAMTHAVETCVHCGFCLSACPTYSELQQEMDSPRGRIVLMKEVLEDHLPWSAAQPHVDRCLGCLACEPACPSGVPYRDLISPFRSAAKKHFRRSLGQKTRHFILARTLPYPKRLRPLVRLAVLGRWLRPFLPRRWAAMLNLLPSRLDRPVRWPECVPAQGERRGRVALLLGCGQQVLAPDINSATVDVLVRNGIEVMIPANQGCCGALAWHAGDLEAARAFALRNLEAFPTDVDAIVSNAAGCGTAMREADLILRGTEHQAKAEAWRHHVMDVSRYLAQVGLRPAPPALASPLKVAYQDACHLAHGQNVRDEPRMLLRAIAGLELCEMAEPHLCCGSAGTYNIDEPEIAARLGERKAQALIATGAHVAVTGNIGCLMQLRMHLARRGSNMRVVHTMQVLRDLYATELAPTEPTRK